MEADIHGVEHDLVELGVVLVYSEVVHRESRQIVRQVVQEGLSAISDG